jgi:hypothetical protein
LAVAFLPVAFRAALATRSSHQTRRSQGSWPVGHLEHDWRNLPTSGTNVLGRASSPQTAMWEFGYAACGQQRSQPTQDLAGDLLQHLFNTHQIASTSWLRSGQVSSSATCGKLTYQDQSGELMSNEAGHCSCTGKTPCGPLRIVWGSRRKLFYGASA